MPFITNISSYQEFIEDKEALYNGYVSDMNNPKLDNDFFLLFDSEKTNNIEYKNLEASGYFISKKNIVTLEGPFRKYTFEIPINFEEEYNKIKDSNYYELNLNTKLKIMSFWNASITGWLFDLLFVSEIEPIDVSKEYVPEETLKPEKLIAA